MNQQREYLDRSGRSPFGEWQSAIDELARTKVSIALLRLRDGNISHVKSVGGGVSELKIDFGPGYRVYFGRAGPIIVILLGGGSKKSQQTDIEKARARWADYKHRKSLGT
ncbi:MAG TPA: type II toxin-antitoxin system RelE/ParE family toxin [Rhizomicrobium sp.]|jgi:putative addiction module killer protein